MYTAAEIKAAGLDDFRVFLRQVWDYLGLPPPTPVQNDIAYNLQHGDRRMIVQAFRGVGKSWITVAFVLWNLFLNPQLKIEVVSASQPLADDFSKFCKQLINGMPLLQHLRAGQHTIRDSAISWDVGPAKDSKDPSVKSAGITGQITGTRADIIVADDIEVPKNSYTHHLREKLAEQVKEFDAILKPGGRIVYLGTPQVEQSLYNKLATRGYKIMVWPAEIPQRIDAYKGRLAQFVIRRIERGAKPGEPMDPVRFDRADLNERLLSYGTAGYALQFLLDTNPSETERHPLKLSDLIVHDCDPEMGHIKLVWSRERECVLEQLEAAGFDGDVYHRPGWKSDEMAKYTGTVMAIDPSGKGKDETGYAIVRYLHGILYLVACGGFLDGYSEKTLGGLAAMAAAHGVTDVVIEENYGGGMFTQLLKPHLAKYAGKAGRVDDEYKVWSHGQKEARICDTLEPVMKSHKLVVDRRVIEADLPLARDNPQYSWVHQMTRMTRDKGALPHEDRLEAIAMAVAFWTDKMNRDQDKALKGHLDALKDAELKRFIKHVVGVIPKPSRSRLRR